MCLRSSHVCCCHFRFFRFVQASRIYPKFYGTNGNNLTFDLVISPHRSNVSISFIRFSLSTSNEIQFLFVCSISEAEQNRFNIASTPHLEAKQPFAFETREKKNRRKRIEETECKTGKSGDWDWIPPKTNICARGIVYLRMCFLSHCFEIPENGSVDI